jgi:hypothetical protein
MLATCGYALAQEEQAKSPPEQLQCYEQLVGNWICETTMEEDIPGLAEKGTKLVLRSSWQWILDKQAIETSWSARPEGKPRIAGRGLLTWDTAGSGIVGGGVNSMGGHGLERTTYDAATKTWTTKLEGPDGQGRQITATLVVKLIDANSYTFQITEQAGGDASGPSALYTYKRDTQVRKPRAGAKSVEKTAEKDDDK